MKQDWRRHFEVKLEGGKWNTYDARTGERIDRYCNLGGMDTTIFHLRYMHPMCLVKKPHKDRT